MRNKYLLLTIGLVCFSFSPSFSWADDLKGPDPNLAQTVQGSIPNKIDNPHPPVSNPPSEVKSGGVLQDSKSQTPAAVKIQEGTNAED